MSDTTTREGRAKHSIERGMKYPPIPPWRKIAFAIYADVTDRKGIKREFGQVDPDIIDDILADWEEIARQVIQGEV